MKLKSTSIAAIAAASILTAGWLNAAGKASIKDVMKAAMKGENSLFQKVCKGQGTEADAQKLANCLKNLEGAKAPKGDQAAFERKVAELVKAASDFAGGNKQAQSVLQRAGNCKACHSAHRES